MSSLSAKLIPLDGSPPITIDREVTIVGRKPGLCDIVIEDGSISKLHCALAKTDGLLFVRDLGSTNGTKVNGQRVSRGALLPGDEVAFAAKKFRVHLGPGEPEVTSYDRTEEIESYPLPDPPGAEDFANDDSDLELASEADDSDEIYVVPDDAPFAD
ncbi:MAG: FHA domain-containing protein [Planctomycetaceae bacterium]|nr:FHA domain-containing protein [Planctomycetaceae bacterium]MCB9954218.1 FHA domain-containing protein [Planctomycetaceae bacterium]